MADQEEQKQRLAAGWSAVERRELRSAEELARSVLLEDPAQIEFVRLLGASLFLQERYREALASFREVFAKARTWGAGYHLGYCHLELKDPRSASEVLEQVVREFPEIGVVHNLLGISLVRQGRHQDAVPHFTAAVERAPQLAEAFTNLGNTLSELGRYEEALPHFESAIEADPADAQARNNLGNALFWLRRTEEAVACYRKAIELAPDYARAHCNLAAALVDQNRSDEALRCCEKAVALDPRLADAHANMGLAYQGLYRFDEAIACQERALALDPGYAEAHANIGVIRHKQERWEDAVASHRRAITLRPGFAKAHVSLGLVLLDLKRYEEAIDSFRKALDLDPANRYALGGLLRGEVHACSWDALSETVAAARRGIRQGRSVIDPFFLLAVSQDPQEQRLCAEGFLADVLPSRPVPLWKGEHYAHDRIRVAYLSADFREHAVGYCVQGLPGAHDRSRFEVIGISFGASDGSAVRAILEEGFDEFIDVRDRSDFHVAHLLREKEVDIAVDLMGYTRGCRPGILAFRPAPVQVEYLGYTGTTGADYMDYVIADRWVIPEQEQRHYSEQVVFMPESYLVNHSRRVVGEPPLRAQLGLPEGAFVFCCISNNYKITPAVFEVWMRLLSKVEGSVLWLMRDNAAAEANLRKEAAARGVDPRRLVFAPFVKRIEEHYARIRLADLYLDTSFNGHVTGTDALWSGLPMLTCASRAFAGRVATSLLHSVGLPELVTYDLAEYEAMALKLARDPALLKTLRARLEQNRRSAPLFDTDLFRRRIESAYTTMWEMAQRGEKPRTFSVPA